MKKIAIFASGTGTNFVALVQAIRQQQLPVTVALLVCDRKNATVLEKATQLQVPSFVIDFKTFSNKAQAEATILAQLQQHEITAILLAGYMRIIGPTLLAAYPNRILNIHPALLPAFPGAHGIKDAFEAGVSRTGVTVHYIDADIDSGPIVAQKVVSIEPEDTLETLEARIHQVEHRLYPAVLADLIKKGDL